ncbi:hypothetical protein MMC31_002505 [Peltigera leucophlebia]|nr:hypothetical protein [Peltigera leucophlebia]
MADPPIDRLQHADPSSTHPADDDEIVDEADVQVAYVTGDSELTYISGKTRAAGKVPVSVDDFVDFQNYLVNDTIVHRDQYPVYSDKNENLIRRLDTKFQGFEWVFEFGWINETSTANTYTHTHVRGLTIQKGQETEHNFSVSAAFKGLGVNFGGTRKTFTSEETSTTTTVERHVVVEAKATTYLYQKHYNFLQEVWFWQKVPSWENHNHFRIGADVTYNIVKRTAVVSIASNEYATLNRRLSGSTYISAIAAPPISPADPGTVRQFTNITKKAKNHLKNWGIYG